MPPIPCSYRGTRRSACRHSRASAGTFRTGLRIRHGRSTQRIDRIGADPAAPTFANTIEALERATRLLDRVSAVFFNLTGAHSTRRWKHCSARSPPSSRRSRPSSRSIGRSSRASTRSMRGATPSVSTPSNCGPRTLPSHVRALRSAPRRLRPGAPQGRDAAPREPRHGVRPERAAGRARLDPAARARRSRGSAGVARFRRHRGWPRARPRPSGHHPVAQPHRPVPATVATPGPARTGLRAWTARVPPTPTPTPTPTRHRQ